MTLVPSPLEKPLEQSIVQQAKQFQSTESEWRGRVEENIFRETNVSAGGSTTIFTVPANSTLFITNIYLSVISSGVNVQLGDVRILGVGNQLLRCIAMDNTSNSVAINLMKPIKIEVGQSIAIVGQGTTGNTLGGFHGWLEKKRVAPGTTP